MAKQKSEIKIVAIGKPDILLLPVSIGAKVLRRMAAIQESETLTDNVPAKVNSENKKQKSR